MRLTLVAFASPGHAARPWLEPGDVADLLYGAARPEELVEHVSASCGPGHVIVGFHTRHAPTDTDVTAILTGLVERALSTRPELAAWSVPTEVP
ncbi:hypothetical protein ACFQ7A_02520 [Streptomyces sp. NPDC056528]|uniref:hypothetical protein n=1 Tax=Streptomyces sp. NPDC056528 TaxID=3345854 RepID=UPI0036737828